MRHSDNFHEDFQHYCLRLMRWTLLMISHHWFKYCLGAIRQQAIAWADVDSDLPHHLASLCHNELICTTYWLGELARGQVQGWQSVGVPCRASPKKPRAQRSQSSPSVLCKQFCASKKVILKVWSMANWPGYTNSWWLQNYKGHLNFSCPQRDLIACKPTRRK